MLSNYGASEDSWESLGLQGNQPVNFKQNQPWIFIGRTDAETEAPLLWPADEKSQLIEKDSDTGKDRRQKEKRAAEDKRLDNITDSMDMNLSKLREKAKDRKVWHAAASGVTKSWTWLNDWTEVWTESGLVPMATSPYP